MESQVSAASSVIAFKSKRSAEVLYRLTMLLLHSINTRLTIEQVEEIVSKYPRHVLEYMIQRARKIEWNAEVWIVSGKGAERDRERQWALAEYKLSLIDRKTCQERIGEDPKQIEQRETEQAQAQMRVQAQMSQQAAPSPAVGGGAPSIQQGSQLNAAQPTATR